MEITEVNLSECPDKVRAASEEIEAVARKYGYAIAYYIHPADQNDAGLLGFDNTGHDEKPVRHPTFAMDFCAALLQIEPLFDLLKLMIGQKVVRNFIAMAEKSGNTTH